MSGQGQAALIVSEHGYAKRVPVDVFPAQRRYGKGVVAFKRLPPQRPARGRRRARRGRLRAPAHQAPTEAHSCW
ncbi:MAG: DNA gyrase C-terminal beta-propeller domain-containing protein [Ardenticatenia bacterium]|nr:DNA gyrase C-terminal beta-propeller domain-containing protein [Ardenticatenia bacterium]